VEPDEYVELLLVEVQKPFIYANDFRAMKHSPKLKNNDVRKLGTKWEYRKLGHVG
jgi:hypothetical protein